MSQGLTVYCVDLARIRALPGSFDPAWGFDDPYPEDEELTSELALMGIAQNRIEAGDLDSDAALYSYGLKEFCAAVGSSLNNGAVMPCNGLLDFVLQPGHPLQAMYALVFAGPPIKLPAPPGAPVVGHLEPSQLAERMQALAALDLSSADRDTRAILDQYGTWLRTADAEKRGLVSFYG